MSEDLNLPGSEGVDNADEAVYSEPTVATEPPVWEQIGTLARSVPDAMELGAEFPDKPASAEPEIEEGYSYPKALDEASDLEDVVAAVPAPDPAPAAPVTDTAPIPADTQTPPQEFVPREQYDALMALLTTTPPQGQAAPQNAGVPAPDSIQHTAPAPAAQAPASFAPAPSPPVDFVTAENHLAVLEDPKHLNQLLNAVVERGVQQAMLQTIPIAQTLAAYERMMGDLVIDFRRANPDLSERIPDEWIGRFANEIAAKDTNLTHKQVFAALPDYIRAQLKWQKPQAPAAPAVAATQPKRGAFAPPPTATSPPSNGNRTAREDVRGTLNRLAATQFQGQ